MVNKSKIKSLTSIEVFLVLFFSVIVIVTLIYIGNKFEQNILVYNAFALGLIFLIISIASIATFQFVKFKFVKELKNEIMLDLDTFKNKLESKVVETNSRIFGFETNYSKKLKKITRDYSAKAKEIEDIKKELEIKSLELDRKSAHLEIEFCNMRAENIRSRNDLEVINDRARFDIDVNVSRDNPVNLKDEKELEFLYNRIIELNDRYSGICSEEFIEAIYSKLKK